MDDDYIENYETIDETYQPEFDDFDVYNESRETYNCFSCGWEGEEPYIVNAFGEDYFLCPVCAEDLGV